MESAQTTLTERWQNWLQAAQVRAVHIEQHTTAQRAAAVPRKRRLVRAVPLWYRQKPIVSLAEELAQRNHDHAKERRAIRLGLDSTRSKPTKTG